MRAWHGVVLATVIVVAGCGPAPEEQGAPPPSTIRETITLPRTESPAATSATPKPAPSATTKKPTTTPKPSGPAAKPVVGFASCDKPVKGLCLEGASRELPKTTKSVLCTAPLNAKVAFMRVNYSVQLGDDNLVNWKTVYSNGIVRGKQVQHVTVTSELLNFKSVPLREGMYMCEWYDASEKSLGNADFQVGELAADDTGKKAVH